MSAAPPIPLRFQIGARTLLTVSRRLRRIDLPLAQVRGDLPTALPALDRGDDGYLLTSVPADHIDSALALAPGLTARVRQSYTRYFADLRGGYDAWFAELPSRARTDLRRKSKRFAERSGGALDVRAYRTPDEMAAFRRLARALSAKTYQEKLLDAGLPDGEQDRAEMVERAEADAVRGFILFLDGEPASYLHLPADGDTLIYAHLGYDPALSDLSPGTVLQLEAMRALMAEERFAWFDFTQGEGQHKKRFATGGVPCVDLLLMRASLSNMACVGALQGFDNLVALGKRLSEQPLLKPLRALRR